MVSNKIAEAIQEKFERMERERLKNVGIISNLSYGEISMICSVYPYINYIIKDIEHDFIITEYLTENLKSINIEKLKYNFNLKAELFNEIWQLKEKCGNVKNFISYLKRHHVFRNKLVHDYLFDSDNKIEKIKNDERKYLKLIPEKEKNDYDHIFEMFLTKKFFLERGLDYSFEDINKFMTDWNTDWMRKTNPKRIVKSPDK